MDKIKNLLTKVLATWAGIGVALIAIGSAGLVQIPESLFGLFSAETTALLTTTVDIIFQAVGAVILFAQHVRGLFLSKPEPTGQVKILSKGEVRSFIFNPFKVS